MFPAGDATEIGQKGVNLSGGQKARVSLARACYADADVYILDSPLAAVDAIVQTEIFNKCLCGLLEKKTVVLVTQLHDMIESEAADVKILIENGQAKVTYSERKKPRRAFANIHTVAEDQESEGDKDAIDDNAHVPDKPSGTLVEEEEREDSRVSVAVLTAYFHALGGYDVVVAFVSILILWLTFQVGSDLWLSRWTSNATVDLNKASTTYNVMVYGSLGLGAAAFVLVRALLIAHVGVTAAIRLFDDMTQSLLRAPARFFNANQIDRILNRYSEDVSMVDFRLAFAVFGLLDAVAITLFQILTSIYVIGFAGVLILPLAWIYVKVSEFYLSTSREISRLLKTSTSPVLSHVAECEDGVATLRAFGPAYINRAVEASFATMDANSRVWYAEAVVNQWFSIRIHMIGFGVVVLVSWCPRW